MEQTITERISALAERFSQLQDSLRLSNKRFALRFRSYLGSEKKWIAIREGKLAGYLNPERTLLDLERLSSSLDGGIPAQTFYDRLPFTQAMDVRLDNLLGTGTDRRCLICLATTGCGKTVWARRRASDDPETLIYCRARPTWRENLLAISQGLSLAVGCSLERNPRVQVDTLIASLQGGKQRVLLMDEAHDAGVAGMKLIKTLIDETGTRFVYLAYPTEFDRVRAASEGALAEAKQLLGRSLKPIFERYRQGVTKGDIAAYLSEAAGLTRDVDAVADEMLPFVRSHGNLRVLDDAISEARVEADGSPITVRRVHDVLCQLCGVPKSRTNTPLKEAA